MSLNNDEVQEKLRSKSRKLLFFMVFVLVFEGLMRKMLPSSMGMLIFFLKDILCIVGITYVNKAYITGWVQVLSQKWKSTLAAFIPVILFTLIHDPILAVFGLKQYLLYVVIGVLMPFAFTADKMAEFKKFVFFICILLLPTTFIAVLQNSLPATHWLNLSVDGGSLEGFSAAGRLRVSSTFSFTGQYSWFLNIACSYLAARIFWPKDESGKNKLWNTLFYAGTSLALLIGTFITGGRSAVLGCAACLFMGFALSAVKSPGKIVTRGLIGFFAFVMVIGVLRAAKPEFFAAYDERSSDHDESTQSEEMTGRVTDSFMNWTTWMLDQDIVAIAFGNGLGVMSNGSEKISEYARDLKEYTWGTESDFDTTLYEGGFYLAVVWYALRIWMIMFSLKIWQKIKRKEWGVVTSFLVGYIIMNAVLGAVGKQPPVNIWLWIAIGSVVTIKNYNDHLDKVAEEAAKQPLALTTV
jgi:hypothetical protein